jgi:hypothetical protein
MKWFLALMCLAITTSLAIVFVVVQVLIKLAPLLVIGFVVWALVTALRGRQRRSDAGRVIEEHPDSPWIPASTPAAPPPPASYAQTAAIELIRPNHDPTYLVRSPDAHRDITGRDFALIVVIPPPAAQQPPYPHSPLPHLRRLRPNDEAAS